MLKTTKNKYLHKFFLVSIVVKGIDGFLELMGGILMLFTRSTPMVNFIQTLFQHELEQDPTDIFVNYLIQIAQTLSISAIYFVAIYLTIHGAIKMGLFFSLWYKKLWAFPLAAVVLGLFVIYQLIRFYSTHSILLLTLTLLDISILVLLKFEYKRLKNSLQGE